MARKTLVVSIFLALVIFLGVFTLKGFTKETKSVGSNDISVLSEKIDTVLKNQQEIIEQLEGIKTELDIIKIRASRN